MPGPAAALSFVAAALILLLGGWQIRAARNEALRHAEAETRTLTRSLAQHAERTIETVDLSLGTIVDQVEGGRDPSAIAAYFRGAGLMQQLHNLAVTDETGRWRADTAPPHPPVDSADRAYFQWFATHRDLGLFFAPVVMGRTSGKPGFPVSRRIEHADGSFAGVAVATFAPEYFVDFYKRIRIGGQGTIALWTRDGDILLRYPELSADRPRGRLAEAAKVFSEGPDGLIRSPSPWDGVERLFAFEHVGKYPLVVSVGLSVDDALAEWRRAALIGGGVIVAAAFALVMLGAVLDCRRRQALALEALAREEVRARAEDEARFRHELEGTNRLLLMAEEIAQTGHWRLDVPSDTLTWSHEIYRIHGRDPATYTPTVESAIAHYHPDDRAEVARLVGEAVEARRNFQLALRILRPDGSLRHVVSRGVCETGPDGGLAAVFGTFMDVTELRLSEAALAESEARYRSLVEDQSEMISLAGVDGTLRFVNGAYARRFDLAPEDLVGRSLFDFVPSALRPAIEADWRRAAATPGSVSNENEILLPDGSTRWIAWTNRALVDDRGRVTAIHSVGRDIEERVSADRRLRESEARYKVLAETTSDVITQIDLSLHRRYVSPACRKLLGFDPEELIGETPYEKMHPDEAEAVRSLAARLATGRIEGDRVVTTYRTRHKDGRWVWVEAVLNLLRDEETGAPLSIISSLRDVTERQRAARHLERAAALSAQAARAKAEFLANMSHELRTPLTGLIGVHDLLKVDPGLSGEQRRLVKLAGDAGRSLLTVVNDVLDVSKIDAGQLVIETVPFNADQLISGCAELVRHGLDGKPVSLVLDRRPDPLGSFRGDPTRIQQVLLNVLTNAAKFTTEGRITLHAAYDDDTSTLRVEVTDTGIGIPAERLEALFERFTQADTSVTRRYGGTGLGLAICKRLVELMHGRIGARNRPEGGSLFWFELPLARHGAVPNSRSDDRGVAEARRGHRILLAEDNTLNAEIVCAMLASRGHDVVHATDGAAALTALEAAPFDVILMDMQMPVLDGLSASRRIREREQGLRSRRTPIIGLTANAFGEDALACLEAGMDAHISKPVDWSVLLDTIERLAVAPGEADRTRGGPPPGSAPAVLDADCLEELARLIGRDRVSDLLLRFGDDLARRLAVADQLDATQLLNLMHALTATAGQLGFAELSALCEEIDRDIRERRTTDRVAEFRETASRARDALRASGFVRAA